MSEKSENLLGTITIKVTGNGVRCNSDEFSVSEVVFWMRNAEKMILENFWGDSE